MRKGDGGWVPLSVPVRLPVDHEGADRRKEADMFIGEIEEIGVIEPLVVPEVLPVERESEPAEPRRVEEPVPAG